MKSLVLAFTCISLFIFGSCNSETSNNSSENSTEWKEVNSKYFSAYLPSTNELSNFKPQKLTKSMVESNPDYDGVEIDKYFFGDFKIYNNTYMLCYLYYSKIPSELLQCSKMPYPEKEETFLLNGSNYTIQVSQLYEEQNTIEMHLCIDNKFEFQVNQVSKELESDIYDIFKSIKINY